MDKKKAKLIGAIRLSKFLELSEDDFKSYVEMTRANLWFKKIYNAVQMNLWGEPVSGFNFDASKFKQIKKTATPDELDEIEILRRRVRMITIRNDMTKRVIEKVREVQYSYLGSGDKTQLVPLTQTEISKILGMDNALVNKIIQNGHLLKLESGQTIKLKELFPSTRDIIRSQIENIIKDEKQPLSDEEIKNRLKNKICRRLVAQCRKEIGIQNSFRRSKKP